MDIVDLHCDLLCYLNHDRARTPYDREVRCSIPQLKAGRVAWQVMAAFVETEPDSSRNGWQQAAIFQALTKNFSEHFKLPNAIEQKNPDSADERITISLAIENASGLCHEDEPLDLTFQRIKYIEERMAKITYVSLTWNTANRFGGGALEQGVGLREDGQRLLEFLDGRQIALDLSHASDSLAQEALNFIDKRNLRIPILASHSNCRAITDHPRNLPDEFLQEIIHRQGLIGVNFIRSFIGLEGSSGILKHINRILEFGGENVICFGADFFYCDDLASILHKSEEEIYYPDLADATVYSSVLEQCSKELQLGKELLEKFASRNAKQFLSHFIHSAG